MTLAITYSRACIGIHAPLVTVETHISNGLPALHIVGLPETAVKESRERVRSAIITSNFEFPTRRITINLAPADLPKNGGRYDLAIAMGILAASKQIPSEKLNNYEFAAELALSGELRPIQSVLPFALGAHSGNRGLILSYQNAEEAALISQAKLYPANHLLEVCSHFLDREYLSGYQALTTQRPKPHYQDLSQVKGQHHAKRALEIAAAGQHSLLMIGSPGVGKTMLSNCLPGILPPLNEKESVELAAIQSVAGLNLDIKNWSKRPFRAPHHSASSIAMIGGSNPPKPGEISLAHHGVLFLDELPEFKRQALEALREPLESGTIAISRAKFQVQYPAKFQLIAAMNPCPCGNYGNSHLECLCLPDQIKKYQSRVSGPLLDRIDLQAELYSLPSTLLINSTTKEESSMAVAQRVLLARTMQLSRAQKPNALLNNEEIKHFCVLNTQEQLLVENIMHQKKFSARSYSKILKIARTIADLDQANEISTKHLKEAFSYRIFENFKKL